MASGQKIGQIGRGSGMFTKDDRRYLLGEKDFSDHKNPDNSRDQQVSRIRERIENGIKDFALLSNERGLKQLKYVLQDLSDPDDLVAFPSADEELVRALDRMHGVLFATMYLDLDLETLYRLRLEGGINRVLQDQLAPPGTYPDVAVNFEFDRYDGHDDEELLERFKEETLISLTALQYLARTSKIDQETLDAYIKNRSTDFNIKMIYVHEMNLSTLTAPDDLPPVDEIEDALNIDRSEF